MHYSLVLRGRPIIVEWERRKAFGGPLSFESTIISSGRCYRIGDDGSQQPSILVRLARWARMSLIPS
ncbi:hypothetical protein EVAR_89098_1 [Eumeta japonica]|uniref:Uncharacterized protein n=1 Tax=Eumeta variegata TaxID=151549 RepID=A0A4C1XE63_EUMVA|nr:hypothetical protein EVAR_89098_1 [Eumeta japonica]